jgi:polysaccharide biosynthesis/export protein
LNQTRWFVLAVCTFLCAGAETVHQTYTLGPDDVLTLLVPDEEELSNKPLRVDLHGDINFPLIGKLHVSGLTVDAVESQINDRLHRYLHAPAAVVTISEYKSQPVSVLGSVTNPGVYQVAGRRTLVEVISLAGGFRPDAGNVVAVTRDISYGPIPIPGAHKDPTGRFSIASIGTKKIVGALNPADNIEVRPFDIISVPKSEVVYVVGSVHKPGGFPLGDNESLSALQVLSLAEGLDKNAAPNRARLLRTVQGQNRRIELAIDLKQMMNGKLPDSPLQKNDILFVPNSTSKTISNRTIEAVVQAATGIAIYSR